MLYSIWLSRTININKCVPPQKSINRAFTFPVLKFDHKKKSYKTSRAFRFWALICFRYTTQNIDPDEILFHNIIYMTFKFTDKMDEKV